MNGRKDKSIPLSKEDCYKLSSQAAEIDRLRSELTLKNLQETVKMEEMQAEKSTVEAQNHTIKALQAKDAMREFEIEKLKKENQMLREQLRRSGGGGFVRDPDDFFRLHNFKPPPLEQCLQEVDSSPQHDPSPSPDHHHRPFVKQEGGARTSKVAAGAIAASEQPPPPPPPPAAEKAEPSPKKRRTRSDPQPLSVHNSPKKRKRTKTLNPQPSKYETHVLRALQGLPGRRGTARQIHAACREDVSLHSTVVSLLRKLGQRNLARKVGEVTVKAGQGSTKAYLWESVSPGPPTETPPLPGVDRRPDNKQPPSVGSSPSATDSSC